MGRVWPRHSGRWSAAQRVVSQHGDVDSFCIGAPGRDRVEVRIDAYARPPSRDPYEDWLNADVTILIGSFSGRFCMAILPQELVALLAELTLLHSTLRGEAAFEAMEGQLSLHFVGNGPGGIAVQGRARDLAGPDNLFTFGLSVDEDSFRRTIEELNDVVFIYPVRAG